jgi:hypothetical protein
MSYFDRLPLYVTDIKPEVVSEPTSFWNFPTYITYTPIEKKQNPIFICHQEVSEKGQPMKAEAKEQKNGNCITYNEWVDNMLEEMYLNENGQYSGEKCYKGYWEHKNCQDNKANNEEEELMFQLDLDWDIEKGRA